MLLSNIPEHVFPHAPLHRHGLAVFQFNTGFPAVAGEAGHFLAKFFVELGNGLLFLGVVLVVWCFGFRCLRSGWSSSGL